MYVPCVRKQRAMKFVFFIHVMETRNLVTHCLLPHTVHEASYRRALTPAPCSRRAHRAPSGRCVERGG